MKRIKKYFQEWKEINKEFKNLPKKIKVQFNLQWVGTQILCSVINIFVLYILCEGVVQVGNAYLTIIIIPIFLIIFLIVGLIVIPMHFLNPKKAMKRLENIIEKENAKK